jgi:hypothetical protein
MQTDEDFERIATFPIARVPGARVAETWQDLRQRPGVTPVLLGSREAAAFMLERIGSQTESAESFIDRALSLDLDGWITERVRQKPDLYTVSDSPADGADRRASVFVPAHNYRGDPYPEVFFALIPVDAPWLAAAHLKIGGLDDCPDAAVHTAFFRRWFERYGAVVTTVADGVLEFKVERPPMTPEAARDLAYEQFVYCPYIVHELMGRLANLAATLLGNPQWYLWWGP